MKNRKQKSNEKALELLKKELNEIQDDLLSYCGANTVFDYLNLPKEDQQGLLYILVNSKDPTIKKLRIKEERLIEAVELLGHTSPHLSKILQDFSSN
jgi:hypothetical protein